MRYHGGKFRLAPWIIGHFPAHRIYTESFFGAGSVFFLKPAAFSEIINDLDSSVVNVFRVLRDPVQAEELAKLLTLTPFARSEWKVAYEATNDPVESARRTIARSFMGFGSDAVKANRKTGFRSNANSAGTTPAIDWARYPAVIRSFTERLQGVLIDQKNAAEMMLEHDGPATLHYVDPPYPYKTRSDVRGYSHELTDDGHRELSVALRALRGFVVLSGYRCDLYDELFGDWERVDRDVIVFRSSQRVESLWLSPVTVRALDQSSMFGRLSDEVSI